MLVVAGCDEKPDVVMPDVTGKSLDVAKSDIKDAGYSGDVDVDGGGLFGVVVDANWQVCEQSPAAGATVAGDVKLTVDRSCGEDESSEPEPSATAEEPQPDVDTYVYAGPQYEVVTIDKGAGMAVIDQYWVLTGTLDYSTAAYKDQVKLIIADVARTAGTAEVIVQVVTDAEIIEAESNATIADFMNSHDANYWNDVMVAKEASSWVASYTGGIDYNAGALSDADAAFAIDWWPAGAYEAEAWRPVIVE